MYNRRGQAGAAGALLALLAVFILLYMLLIPPDMRDALLNDQPLPDGKTPSTDVPAGLKINKTVLTESPGRIDYLKVKQFDHPLPAINLYTKTEAEQQDIGNDIYVKNGIFDKKTANLTFRISNPDQLDNVYLSFRVNPNRNNKGQLRISLNGNTLIDGNVGSTPEPIAIGSGMLESTNVVSFEVSGVGYLFWTTNEYELTDLKLVYESSDISTQTSRNTFMVTDTEKFNLEKASLAFTPDCQTETAGTLTVTINNQEVYGAVPDCGSPNYVEFSSSVIEAGTDKVVFHSDRGRYLIDNILVKTTLKTMAYPRYDFELDSLLFSKSTDVDTGDEDCGAIDGICPSGCDADQDKDCCLDETSNYWCDYQPNNQDDRCRAVTSNLTCQLCPSGYEDKSGEPPEKCDRACGDDTDNKCPTGCSRYYDKDCCFDVSEENFWCDDIPEFGLATCKEAITKDDCDACEAGWESEGSDFECSATNNDDSSSVLSSRYDVKLTLKFFDDNEKKTGKIYVNGYQFYFYTYTDEYTRVIDNYVESGTNTIKIEPDQTVLDIRKLLVEVEY
jgi:hypothetical protein